MLDYQKLWVEALGVIEKEVSPANFGTWFKNTRIARENEGVVYIGVPNLFVKDWLYQKYHKMILRSVRLLLPEVRAVEYSIVKNEPLPAPLATQNTFQPQPPLQELYTNKEDGAERKLAWRQISEPSSSPSAVCAKPRTNDKFCYSELCRTSRYQWPKPLPLHSRHQWSHHAC
jgi:chromosomal replication initiator protein